MLFQRRKSVWHRWAQQDGNDHSDIQSHVRLQWRYFPAFLSRWQLIHRTPWVSFSQHEHEKCWNRANEHKCWTRVGWDHAGRVRTWRLARRHHLDDRRQRNGGTQRWPWWHGLTLMTRFDLEDTNWNMVQTSAAAESLYNGLVSCTKLNLLHWHIKWRT